MKKIMAFILAIVISLSMTTLAFAVGWDEERFDPGSEILLTPNDFTGPEGSSIGSAYFSSDYFTIYKIKYEKGSSLVDSIKFNNEGELVIKLKANYALAEKSIPNFKIDVLEIKAKKDGKEFSRNEVFRLRSTDPKKVGYEPKSYYLGSNNGIDLNSEQGLWKFVKDDKYVYEDLSIKANDIWVDVRVYEDEVFYFEVTTEPFLSVVKANPDADLEFIGFRGSPIFSNNATVEISADKNQYLYEIRDGKLIKTNFKWDKDSYVFRGKTRTVGYYVISDKELKAASSTETDDKDKNGNTQNPIPPNTGANDFVGVAIALASVSLVAAGAAVVKKK